MDRFRREIQLAAAAAASSSSAPASSLSSAMRDPAGASAASESKRNMPPRRSVWGVKEAQEEMGKVREKLDEIRRLKREAEMVRAAAMMVMGVAADGGVRERIEREVADVVRRVSAVKGKLQKLEEEEEEEEDRKPRSSRLRRSEANALWAAVAELMRGFQAMREELASEHLRDVACRRRFLGDAGEEEEAEGEGKEGRSEQAEIGERIAAAAAIDARLLEVHRVLAEMHGALVAELLRQQPAGAETEKPGAAVAVGTGIDSDSDTDIDVGVDADSTAAATLPSADDNDGGGAAARQRLRGCPLCRWPACDRSTWKNLVATLLAVFLLLVLTLALIKALR